MLVSLSTSRYQPLERQIIVRVGERAREVFEIFRGRRSRFRLRGRRRRSRRRRGAAAAGVAIKVAPASTPRRAEHDELADVDLGAVARLPVLVLPLAVFDAAFDV